MKTYERWLIARGNVFAPSADAVVKLVGKLREDTWIPAGKGQAVRTIENTFGHDEAAKLRASTEEQPAELTKDWLNDPEREELRLVWPATGAEARWPLSISPAGDAVWALEIHRATDFVYPVNPHVGPLPTTCRCDEDLSFAWDEEEVVPAFRASTGIFTECEDCSRTFDPSKGVATITNPFDRTKEKVPGGGAYQFALKVVATSGYAEDPKLAFAPELVALVEKEFGRSFFELATLG